MKTKSEAEKICRGILEAATTYRGGEPVSLDEVMRMPSSYEWCALVVAAQKRDPANDGPEVAVIRGECW